jgi:hypothetical protein
MHGVVQNLQQKMLRYKGRVIGDQRPEVGGQKSEGRGQKAEDGSQKSAVGGQRAEGGRESRPATGGDGGHRAEVKGEGKRP